MLLQPSIAVFVVLGLGKWPPSTIRESNPIQNFESSVTLRTFLLYVSMFRDARYLPEPQSYQPHVPEEHRVWPFRKALMREYLLSKDADVVCVQEASAETFEADFDFMKDAG